MAMDGNRNMQAWLTAIVGNVSDLISVYDTTGELVYMTPSVSRFVGAAATIQITSRDAMSMVHPDDRKRMYEAFAIWSCGGVMALPVSYRARHVDGTWHDLEGYGRHFVADSGEHGVVIASRDCTNPQRAGERLAEERRLQEGIDLDQFIVYYQPEVSIDSGELLGFEALARWQHPERGLVAPDGFIELAELTGLIVPLGRSILRQACAWAARYHSEVAPGARLPWVSVNVSARQLMTPRFVEEVAETLASCGLDPDLLWLEITETMLMNDLVASKAALDRLRGLGVHLSIDDFGTGWSSLAYLKRFPVEQLKVDRSFTAGVGTNADDTSIVTAVIAMAHSLGISVVAEGVETEGQLQALRDLHCDVGQGYHWTRPMPAERASVWHRSDCESNIDLIEADRRSDAVALAGQGSGTHSVEFFDHGEFPARSFAQRLVPVLDNGDVVLVVASADNRDLIEAELVAAGVQVDAARRRGQYVALDARAAIERVLVEGRPDRDRFHAVAEQVISRVGRSGTPVVVCAEMVAALDDDTDICAAVELETLWNEARLRYGFSLICAYPLRSFAGLDGLERFATICEQHDHVRAVPQDVKALGGRVRDDGRADDGDDRAVIQRLVRKLRQPISSAARLLAALDSGALQRSDEVDSIRNAIADIADANRVIDVLVALAALDAAPADATPRDSVPRDSVAASPGTSFAS